MFSGEAGWAEIQRCCLWVRANAKYNKTLWGRNQTQSDRNTKAHMLIHSVDSVASFFTLPIFISFSSVNWPLYCWLTCLARHYGFWLPQPVEFLVSAKCHVRLPQTGLRSACLWGYHCVLVCGWVGVCFTPILAWRGQQILFPSLYLLFSASLIPSPPLSCLPCDVLGEQLWRESHRRGINQMQIELAWLLMPNEWGRCTLGNAPGPRDPGPRLAPSSPTKFFIFIST